MNFNPKLFLKRKSDVKSANTKKYSNVNQHTHKHFPSILPFRCSDFPLVYQRLTVLFVGFHKSTGNKVDTNHMAWSSS